MAVFSTEQPGLEAPEGLEAVAVDATPPPPVVNPDVAVPAGQGACYIYQASLPTDPVQVGTICSIRTQQDCHASANPHAYIFLEGVPCTQPLPQCGNAQVVVNEVGTAIHANPNVSRNQARDMCNNAVTRDVAAFACPQNCRAGAAHFRWLEEVSELIMSQTLTQTTARCAALIRCYPAPPPSPELLWH